MLEVFKSASSWWLLITAMGLISFPLCSRLFSGLPDRGYNFSKLTGLLLTGMFCWAGKALGLAPTAEIGAWICLVLVAACSTFLFVNTTNKEPFHIPRGILVSELVFAMAFFTWVYVRSHGAEIAHTEQPMDFMLMNAIYHSSSFPIEDPWLAGYPIGYYIFGHWLAVTPAWLLNTPVEEAYSLAQCLWFGLLVSGCFGIGFNLARQAKSGLTGSIFAGTLSSLSVACVSNLRGISAALYASGGTWWWSPSRVVKDLSADGHTIECINEFPAFSYFLGDNHAHLLAQPLLVLVIALSLNRFLGFKAGTAIDRKILFSFEAIVLAAILCSNSWDFPIAGLLLTGAVFQRSNKAWRNLRAILFRGIGLLILTILIALPHLLVAQSQAGGIAWNHFGPSSVAELLNVFGLFLPGILLLWTPLLLKQKSKSSHFAMGLCLAGFLLILIPELVYLRDDFDNRMNSLFKFHYQAWLFLGLSSAWGGAAAWRNKRMALLVLIQLIFIGYGMRYIVRASSELIQHSKAEVSLDALHDYKRAQPGEWEAIQWIRRNVKPGERLIEATGQSYNPRHSRFSSISTRPTLIGWEGHERQWRGADYDEMASQRAAWVHQVYTTADLEELVFALEDLNASWLVVGPVERQLMEKPYSTYALYQKVLQLKFQNDEVRIYHYGL